MSNRRGKRIGRPTYKPSVRIPAPGQYRDPATKQKSEWRVDEATTRTLRETAARAAAGEIAGALETDITAWTRNVRDGRLDAYIGTIPGEGLHMSIAYKKLVRGGWVAGRYPTWDEIAHARDCLLPSDKAFNLPLPKPEDYLAIHPTTFHLHEDLPAGVVRGTDGSTWTAQPVMAFGDKVATDESGYIIARLVPYNVGVVQSPTPGGESDVDGGLQRTLP